MGSILNGMLIALSDGKWRSIGILAKNLGVSVETANMIATFLAKYGFIEHDNHRNRIRIKPELEKDFHSV